MWLVGPIAKCRFLARFKEVVTSFENLLLAFEIEKDLEFEIQTGKPYDSLWTSPSIGMIELIERIWSDDVYLTLLRSRFWKLTLQVGMADLFIIGENSCQCI
jgi:hypothetical protein